MSFSVVSKLVELDCVIFYCFRACGVRLFLSFSIDGLSSEVGNSCVRDSLMKYFFYTLARLQGILQSEVDQLNTLPVPLVILFWEWKKVVCAYLTAMKVNEGAYLTVMKVVCAYLTVMKV